MKFLVTGGNRGLGLAICQRFNGHSLSRSTGHDITKEQDRRAIAEQSLDYDVFVNNAFDGPFQESWADFGQTHLLWQVGSCWKQNNKNGLIINIGSIGSETTVAPEPSFETYRISKVTLKSHSLQWSQAFKENQVLFRTTLLTLDRLDTELSRSRPTWTGNGLTLDDVMDWIDLLTKTASNTCIQEIVTQVNLHHKQQ